MLDNDQVRELEFAKSHLTLGLLSVIMTNDSKGNYCTVYTCNTDEIMLEVLK